MFKKIKAIDGTSYTKTSRLAEIEHTLDQLHVLQTQAYLLQMQFRKLIGLPIQAPGDCMLLRCKISELYAERNTFRQTRNATTFPEEASDFAQLPSSIVHAIEQTPESIPMHTTPPDETMRKRRHSRSESLSSENGWPEPDEKAEKTTPSLNVNYLLDLSEEKRTTIVEKLYQLLDSTTLISSKIAALIHRRLEDITPLAKEISHAMRTIQSQSDIESVSSAIEKLTLTIPPYSPGRVNTGGFFKASSSSACTEEPPSVSRNGQFPD